MTQFKVQQEQARLAELTEQNRQQEQQAATLGRQIEKIQNQQVNVAAIEKIEAKSVPLYYRVVVFIAPIQGLCYTVRDAVDWFRFPTARRFLKGSNHSPLQYC